MQKLSQTIRYHRFGQPVDVLQKEQRPLPTLAPSELLVQMRAMPINPSDLIPIRGAYAHRTPLPAVPGFEGVGVVAAVGPGVSSAWIGRRVLPLRGEGTWQEHVICSAELAIPVPDTMEDDIACQLYINPITAYVICTQVLRLQAGDVLLINAGGSAIGRIFAQLAREIGFLLIAVTRNRAHTEDLLALGAWQVIDDSQTSTVDAVLSLTGGQGATAAIDSVGGGAGLELIRSTRRSGDILSIGLLSGVQVNWGEANKKYGVHAKLFHLRHWNADISAEMWHATFAYVLNMVEQKRLVLRNPGSNFELDDIHSAVLAAETPHRNGKVILRPQSLNL